MNRRTAINIGLTTAAGIFLIPGCVQHRSKPYPGLKNISISEEQEKSLAALAETIIPKTSTPGAIDIKAQQFALVMVDDCFDPESRSKFIDGFAQFEDISQKRYGCSVAKCSDSQRKELLTAMEKKTDIPETALFFYNSFKRLTMQGFTSSQYYLTKIHPYELVPGRFHGCVPVKKLS